METDVQAELKAAVAQILSSSSRKKLVVAGPGTGKTTVFRALLEAASGNQKNRLVLTFINNLKIDLEKSLSDLATVSTLHGYCQGLLRKRSDLRSGLTEDFLCVPGLASIIKSDWEYLLGEPAPEFVKLMRNLAGDEINFYLERANFYDAVDFDDSVYRTYVELKKRPASVSSYELVLIDEYQDFNRMEAGIIELLADRSPIVIAGDDDQALYSQLRGASWEHIRLLYSGGNYEVFPLPFCMRCPEVIVDAVNDIIVKARAAQKLSGRIDKPYRHYEPVKGADSRRYPKIALVMSTVQRANANYFGRYIAEAINNIPKEEIEEAQKKGEPTALIICSEPYRSQIESYLIEAGYPVELREQAEALNRNNGLAILKDNPDSNIGWRVVLEFENKALAASCIREATKLGSLLKAVIPEELRKKILLDAEAWKENKVEGEKSKEREDGLRVKITSFEGAKGLSAQHVFIPGLHEGDLPHDRNNIRDLEVCRFVVGLTRTKKQCSLLFTKRFADKWKQPSVFISWIKPERYEKLVVDANFWKRER